MEEEEEMQESGSELEEASKVASQRPTKKARLVTPLPDHMLTHRVSKEAYAALKKEFETHHFYFVPNNSLVEVSVTDGSLRYLDLSHAAEYLQTHWYLEDEAALQAGEEPRFTRNTPLLKLWSKDPLRRIIYKIDFQPSLDPTVFYQSIRWHFTLHPPPPALTTAEDDTPHVPPELAAKLTEQWDTLVNAVCNGSTVLRDYVLNWLAHMLQKPLELPGTALVLTGPKGVGKDTLLKFVRERVVGAHLSTNYTDTRQFFDKYDTERMGKFFVCAEELDSSGSKAHAKTLRSRITANSDSVNPKNKAAIPFPNYARYAFSSNETMPVAAGDDEEADRRYVLLKVADTLKGRTDFWQSVYDEREGLFTDAGGWLVAQSLLARDLSAFNVRILPPNEYQDALMETERSPEQRFVEDWWGEGEEYKSQDLFVHYTNYCGTMGFTECIKNSIVFGRRMGYFVLHGKVIKRTGHAKQVFYKKAAAAAAATAGAAAATGAEQEEEVGAGVGVGAGLAPPATGGFIATTTMW